MHIRAHGAVDSSIVRFACTQSLFPFSTMSAFRLHSTTALSMAIISIFTYHQVNGDSICRGRATCKSLPNCVPMMALVGSLRKPLKPSVVRFLRAEQCGFADGYPEVCCGVLPHHLNIFQQDSASRRRTKETPLQQAVNKLSVHQAPHFDITVSTAAPGASTVPYLGHLQRTESGFLDLGGRFQHEDLWQYIGMYDLERTRRSKVPSHDDLQPADSSQTPEIEIR